MADQIYEWLAEGISSHYEGLQVEAVNMIEAGYERWISIFQKNQVISGLTEQFPEKEQRILSQLNILSSLIVPIYVDDIWWGVIGFDDCKNPRIWSEPEINFLKTASRIVGAAVNRQIFEQEKNKSIQKIQLSEDKFSRVFRLNPSPMCITRLADGIFLDVNESLLRKSGYDREEIINKSSIELLIFKSEHHRNEILKRLNRKGSLLEQEIDILTKSRELRHGVFSSEVISINGVPCLLSVFQDMTEQKALEKSLRDREQKFRLIFESSPIGIQLFDSSGRFLQINKAGRDILGISPEDDLRSNTLSSFIILTDGEMSALMNGETIHMERVVDVNRINNSPSEKTEISSKTDLEIQITRIVSEATPDIGFLVQFQDITKRKKDEFALRESETRWKFAIEGSGDVLWDWDITKDTIILTNRWREMMQYDENEETTKQHANLLLDIHPDDLPGILEIREKYFSGEL